MNGKEYMQTQMALVQIGKQVKALKLDEFLRAIKNAESAAPILDPTLFRRAQENLQAIKELAESFKTVQDKFDTLYGAVVNTSMGYFVRGEKQPGLNGDVNGPGSDPDTV